MKIRIQCKLTEGALQMNGIDTPISAMGAHDMRAPRSKGSCHVFRRDRLRKACRKNGIPAPPRGVGLGDVWEIVLDLDVYTYDPARFDGFEDFEGQPLDGDRLAVFPFGGGYFAVPIKLRDIL